MSQNIGVFNVGVSMDSGSAISNASSPNGLGPNNSEPPPAVPLISLLRRHRADMGADSPGVAGAVETPQSARYSDTKWEAHESQRQRELEEARARAAQMEKTMKWWSDCTANWREKWSKVRNERNKIREENKQLRVNLDLAMKEANSYKREKNDLEMQISQLKKEMEKVHTLMMKHAGQFNKVGIGDNGEEEEANARDINCSPDASLDVLKNSTVNNEDGLVTKGSGNAGGYEPEIDEFVRASILRQNKSSNFDFKENVSATKKQLPQDEFVEDYLMQKITMLQLRLDEAQKSVQVERDEKSVLHKTIEKLSLEVQEVRDRHEELRAAKQDAVRELLTLQEQHSAELRILNNTLQEEMSARSNLDRRLGELRIELERLQAENASEWGKRERLETEKLALERDNKKLRSEILDCQERSNRKNRPVQSANDAEVRAVQQELVEKNKELSELALTNTKLKKLYAETSTELDHAVRRAEQYEAEVKKLRQRVEELKRNLASAEDELDSAVNHERRLQRTNEVLEGQIDSLQVQLQHLQSSQSHRTQQMNTGSNSGAGIQMRNKIDVELSSECLPNINDLRQLFDYTGDNGDNVTRRSSYNERCVQTQSAVNGVAGNYEVKNCSHVEEQLLELKSRNLDFERAKQKFDNLSHLLLQQNYQLQQQRQQHHQRTPRESSVGRSNGINKSSGSNLALPMKSATTGPTKIGHATNDSQAGVGGAAGAVEAVDAANDELIC